jgi:hypothetical protein
MPRLRLPAAGKHRKAIAVIAACLVLLLADAVFFSHAEKIPLWHGFYVILANAETFGGDIGPTNNAGYLCNFAVCIILIPLFGAVISLVVAGLTENDVANSETNVKAHVADQIKDVKASADAAHRIAADLHAVVTGRPHELAPPVLTSPHPAPPSPHPASPDRA